MEKLAIVRTIRRAACLRYSLVAAANTHSSRHLTSSSRTLFSVPSTSASIPSKSIPFDAQSSLARSIGSTRSFSEDASHMPVIRDPEVVRAFKDLIAADWSELPNRTIHGAKSALSKNTDDKVGQEVLKNVFAAAEAVEEFTGIIMNIKMETDDMIGLSGENVKPLSENFINVLRTVYQRYTTYLDSFGPDESYLRKKIESELGTKMIHLKMRCAGLGPEWGKVTVLGTSGLAGSYVEQRA